MSYKIDIGGYSDLVFRLTKDFNKISTDYKKVPSQIKYNIKFASENKGIERSARIAFFKSMSNSGFRKLAFDTRRINQDLERVPRANLQYWNRSQEFLDRETEIKINALNNLIEPLERIRSEYETYPEYFHSYARSLLDSVKRAVKIYNEEFDVFKPQIDYLEQLLNVRYHITLDDLQKEASNVLYEKILKKDEDLTKKGTYLKLKNSADSYSERSEPNVIIKDSNGDTQNSIINAIFGSSNFRNNGEKKIERTVTITIKDEVLE